MEKIRQQARRVPWWVWGTICVLVPIGLWLTVWLGNSCSVPGRRLAMKAVGGAGGGGGVGCFEFWFYRYQGLLAAAVALGAAIIAVRPVWVQLAEMRKQSAEMARQSAQQAFQTLRGLIVQLAEEEIIVRDIELNASYCTIFEERVSSSAESPAFARTHYKDFERRLEELALLERKLRESGAKSWGSREAHGAREDIFAAILDLRRAILDTQKKIHSVVYRFDGAYNVAEWQKAAENFRGLSMKNEAEALRAACSRLLGEIRGERDRIEPALHEATQAAFGFGPR